MGEDTAKRLEELQADRIAGQAEGVDTEAAIAAALGTGDQPLKTEAAEKQKTAKDIFNNLNKGHESQDKDRKLSAGGPQAEGGGGSGGGTPQPAAPSTSYRAPTIAQSGNAIGGAQQPVKVIAVPVQVDPSALLGGSQGQSHGQQPPGNITPPPMGGTQEKATARAQKYIFDSERDVDEARNRIDILGGTKAPTEPPHTTGNEDKSKDSEA